jgi:hypothetical protein
MIAEGLNRMGIVSFRTLIEKVEIKKAYDNVIEMEVTLSLGLIDKDGSPSSVWAEKIRRVLEEATYSLLVL